MTIPDAAIEAAAKALDERCAAHLSTDDVCGICAADARIALEAAMPAIREALAQKIDHARKLSGDRGEWVDGMYAAARIVRGGTP